MSGRHSSPDEGALQSCAVRDYMARVSASSSPIRAPRPGGWHRFANPGRFLRLTDGLMPWLWAAAGLTLLPAIAWALLWSPPDWQQGETVRIMYVHVPMAWLAMGGYALLALASASALIWRHPLADLAARELSPLGAAVTGLCLLTGSLWGRPMWGAWWVWDARLTSVLVLFFFWMGHATLVRAFEDEERGARMGAILALAGAVNLPIVKFSVEWWNTLHQPASVARLGAPGLHVDILYPLLACTVGLSLLFAALLLSRTRSAILERRVQSLRLARARRLDAEAA